MKGAVAAGHPLTAEAGAQVLRAGGNAVDACIAAAFASWVTESPLTGPGGGGFMLVYRARDQAANLFHFGAASAAVPGVPLGLESVYRRYGSVPWASLIDPAIELARSGVELTRQQAYLHAILDLILRHTDGGRAI